MADWGRLCLLCDSSWVFHFLLKNMGILLGEMFCVSRKTMNFTVVTIWDVLTKNQAQTCDKRCPYRPDKTSSLPVVCTLHLIPCNQHPDTRTDVKNFISFLIRFQNIPLPQLSRLPALMVAMMGILFDLFSGTPFHLQQWLSWPELPAEEVHLLKGRDRNTESQLIIFSTNWVMLYTGEKIKPPK